MSLLFSTIQHPWLPSTLIPSSPSAKVTSHNKKSTYESKPESKSPTTTYTKFTSQRNNTKQNLISISKSQKKHKNQISTFICAFTSSKTRYHQVNQPLPHASSLSRRPTIVARTSAWNRYYSTYLCHDAGTRSPAPRKIYSVCGGGGGVGLKRVREIV